MRWLQASTKGTVHLHPAALLILWVSVFSCMFHIGKRLGSKQKLHLGLQPAKRSSNLCLQCAGAIATEKELTHGQREQQRGSAESSGSTAGGGGLELSH